MNPEDRQLRIQDYLDGRMDDAERREFEALMQRDDELARTVQDYREIGRLLRAAPAELPHGFHARTADRFVESRTPMSWTRRIVSWEAAGLAVAALLVVSILAPVVIDMGFLSDRRAADAEPVSQPAPIVVGEEPQLEGLVVADEDARFEQLSVPATAEPVAGEPPPAAKPRDAPSSRPAPEKKAHRGMASAVGDVAEESDVYEDGPSSVAKARPKDDEAQAVRQEAESSYAPPPPATAESKRRARKENAAELDPDPADFVTPSSEQFADSQDVDRLNRNVGAARAQVSGVAGTAASAASATLTLTTPGVDPESVVVIGDAVEWARWLDGPTGVELAPLNPDFGSQRVVILGPRTPPLDCRTIRYVVGQDEVIVVVRRGSATERNDGCAAIVPSLPVAIRVRTDP